MKPGPAPSWYADAMARAFVTRRIDGVHMSDQDVKSGGAAGSRAANPQPAPTPAYRFKPGVCRMVHYYTTEGGYIGRNNGNGVGRGPYPAIIQQVHGPADSNPHVNLKVFGFETDVYASNVRQLDVDDKSNKGAYYEEPPRV